MKKKVTKNQKFNLLTSGFLKSIFLPLNINLDRLLELTLGSDCCLSINIAPFMKLFSAFSGLLTSSWGKFINAK